MIPGIIAGRAVQGTAPQYLNQLASTPVVALGLTKLISTATAAIRVRRSSDNAEADIGFDGDDLDWAALASHVGANSGYVRTIYDQTGNSHHAQQATNSKQPRIVNAGVADARIMFDGSDDAMQISAFNIGTQRVGLYGDLRFTPDGSARIVVESSANYVSNNHTFVAYAYSTEGGLVCGSHATEVNAVRSRSFPVSGTDIWAVLYDRSLTGSNEIQAWRGASSLTGTNIGTTEQTGNFGNHAINIGARNQSSLYCALQLGSLALYSADTASIRGSIQTILS